MAAITTPKADNVDYEMAADFNELVYRSQGQSADAALLTSTFAKFKKGSYAVALVPPDSLTGNVTLKLPNAIGTAGQALVDDGTGALSFATITGVTDHGALTGLADDDHTQYLALAGRAGGQVLAGASDDTVLRIDTNGTNTKQALSIQKNNANMLGGSLFYVYNGYEETTAGAQIVKFACGSVTATIPVFQIDNVGAGPDICLRASTYWIGFKASASLAANITFVLPSADGTANYPLITSGAKALSFGAITGAAVSGNIAGSAANVTGTVAIANGGTGQTAREAAFDALSPVTTAGDLIIRGASNNDRLAIGSTGQVLTVVAGAPAWAAAAFTSGASVTSIANEDNLTQTNNGTGHAHYINQAGVLASGKHALDVYSNGAQVNDALAYFKQDNASSTTATVQIDCDGIGSGDGSNVGATPAAGLDVRINSVLAAWSSGVRIYSNALQDATGMRLFVVNLDNASSNRTAANFMTNGSGGALICTCTGAGQPLTIQNSSGTGPGIGFLPNNARAQLAMGSLSANPTGPNGVGDVAVVNGKLVICTVAGSPGTWTVVGAQT